VLPPRHRRACRPRGELQQSRQAKFMFVSIINIKLFNINNLAAVSYIFQTKYLLKCLPSPS
jgi:hypothetical protein